MNFHKYCSIENISNEIQIEKIKNCKLDTGEFICAVKIDGANFQCSITDTDEFVTGSRNKFINRYDNFQGYQRAMQNEHVESSLRKMKELISSELSTPLVSNKFILTVFGELCGGMYRHKDVLQVKEAAQIQGRIDYHPDIMWVPFDIVILNPEQNKQYMLTVDEIKYFCDKVELPSQIIKFRGSFDECLNYPNKFNDTTGHDLWKLPIIEGNTCEGVVIKPVIPCWFPNGERVILKNKNSKYAERKISQKSKIRVSKEMNALELEWLDKLDSFVTESRVYSIFSKMGSVTPKDFGVILNSYMDDLMEEFNKLYKLEINKLEIENSVNEFNFSTILKMVKGHSSEVIRPEFIKKIQKGEN